jgi:predicted transcriptional regulator of viral defense system
MRRRKPSLREYLNQIQSSGKYWFTKKEAKEVTGTKENASFTRTLLRWENKGLIAKAKRGFYVVIPPEYRRPGILPPDWFISRLMEFIGQPYYVGLLSAAAKHGAAHQQPMEYQVVVPKSRRALRIGPATIRFFKKSGMRTLPVAEARTPTGDIKISDPALTAIDLVAYTKQVGGLDRVALVIMELKDRINPQSLISQARREPRFATIQRLGWLLDQFGAEKATAELNRLIAARRPRYILLDPEEPARRSAKNSRWKIVENAKLDLDI